jgi:hypothetical protein
MHKISIIRNILLSTLCVVVLSSCGTLRISEADRKFISEGKKSLLVTQNFNLLGRVTRKIILDITDTEDSDIKFDIKQVTINIISIDGKEVAGKWYRANEELAVEPGKHTIEAKYTIKTESKLSPSPKSDTQTIDYLFEGGKRYKIYVEEYLYHYKINIKPY